MQSPLLKQSCTCPSGDGSLRWPCPSHTPGLDLIAAASTPAAVADAERSTLHRLADQLPLAEWVRLGRVIRAAADDRRALLQGRS